MVGHGELVALAGLLSEVARRGELPESLAGLHADIASRLDTRTRAALASWSRPSA